MKNTKWNWITKLQDMALAPNPTVITVINSRMLVLNPVDVFAQAHVKCLSGAEVNTCCRLHTATFVFSYRGQKKTNHNFMMQGLTRNDDSSAGQDIFYFYGTWNPCSLTQYPLPVASNSHSNTFFIEVPF
jgi:hypothetical protein